MRREGMLALHLSERQARPCGLSTAAVPSSHAGGVEGPCYAALPLSSEILCSRANATNSWPGRGLENK